MRFELTTCSLRVSCSTAELKRLLDLSRDDKIRTCDLNVPNVARYQLRYVSIPLHPFGTKRPKDVYLPKGLQRYIFL